LNFQNPSEKEMRKLLETAKTIVVVGLSPRPERPSNRIARRFPALWIQEGIVNEAAAGRARAAGILTVMDRCISIEYRRLMT